MNDVNFVEVDAKKINTELINGFETSLNETLYPSDERRIFLNQETQVIIALKNDINNTAKQNLLRYATGDKLNDLGNFSDTVRLSAKNSYAPCKITLSSIQLSDLIISKGTRVTPDGVLFFALLNDVTIKAGEIEGYGVLESTEPGAIYNNFVSGQIKNIVDPIPFVNSIVNTETSTGGSDIESDDRYRDRIRLSPHSYSTAGPEGAYEYWAKSADATISDVSIDSPSPGVVKITVLQDGGLIPTQPLLDKVFAEVSPKNRRPLTDNVVVSAPTTVSYDVSLTYYLDKYHQTEESKFRRLIEGDNLDLSTGALRDFINWQQEKLGRGINPDELRYRIQNAATYTSEDKSYTAVRRIVLTSPDFFNIDKDKVASLNTISVVYGGLE